MPLDDVPAELRPPVELALAAIRENADAVAALEQASEAVRRSLPQVLACSEFIANSCARDRDLLPSLLAEDLLASRRADASTGRAQEAASVVADEPELMRWMRAWRRREMVRIAWRDIGGWSLRRGDVARSLGVGGGRDRCRA